MVILLILLSASSQGAEKPLVIGELIIKNNFGCIYTEPSSNSKVILYGDYGSSGTAFIDGKNTELKLYKSDSMRAKKAGDKFSVQYRHGKELSAKYVGTRIATCKDEGAICKTSEGKITFEKGNYKELREVTEWCGNLGKH